MSQIGTYPEGFTLHPHGGYAYRGFRILHGHGFDLFGHETTLPTWNVRGLGTGYKTLKLCKEVIDSHPEIKPGK